METSSAVYLDYNAATPPDASVIEAIKNSLEDTWGNPSSSSYSLGRDAKEAIESSREKVARMINAEKTDEILFLSGGTEVNFSETCFS
jgi:cysteine desulfurase